LGYSASNDGVASTVFPSVLYVGRLASDPPGVLSHGEVTMIAGGGSQVASRWGDYSAMRVDPVDGCTYWYTQEYIAAGPNRNTRIGAFRFPTCNPADLVISKSDSPDPVIAGNQLQYTISVLNNGPANATNVAVTDILPAGVTFLSSSIPCPNTEPPAGERTCSLGTLASGALTSFTIQVLIPANFLSSLGVSTANITNTASVAADELDSNPDNNTDSESTNVIERADLRITKTCKPDAPAPAGTDAYCDLVVTNLGVSDAQNVSVTDTLTSNSPFQVISYGTTVPVVCAPGVPSLFVTNFTVNCTVGTLAAGASTTIRVNVISNDGGDVNDSATVSSSTPDPDTSNNLATGHVTFAASANVSVIKTSAPNPVVAGTNFTYTITASNAGPSAATNVVVTDTLPGQISVVHVTPGPGNQCSGGIPGNPAQPLICTLGTINSGDFEIITVEVKVNSSTPDGTILINNVAVSSDAADPNNSNNVFTANTDVNARADLVITKTSDKPNYKPNALITFTVKVENTGPSDALAVVVTDTLPDVRGAIYLSDTGGCTKAGDVLTCNMANMPVGTSKSFNVNMEVKGNRGPITNNVSVASSTTDPAGGNNSTSKTVQVK
jgi:uncharacterized repeat protein (TIGR01451 family)